VLPEDVVKGSHKNKLAIFARTLSMYLFDTNVLSEVLKKRPNLTLMRRLAIVERSLQFTSCICVMELRYGSRRRADHESFWDRIRDDLLSRVEILPITEEIAIVAGDIAGELSLQGIGISAEDLLIAATALHSGLMLITANTRHFEKISSLKLENWLV
jgi:tRNA(fMet)-specific endonuclease VapC